MASKDLPNPYEYSGYNSGYPSGPVEEEGSFGAGLALGAIFGLWGLIGTMIFAKPETKRGARYGFLGRLGLTLLFVCAAVGLGN